MTTVRQGSRRLTVCGRWATMMVMAALLSACQPSSILAPATPSMQIGADSASAPLAESLLNVYESQLAASLLTLETSSREVILAGVTSDDLDAAILFHPLEEQSLFDTPVGLSLIHI